MMLSPAAVLWLCWLLEPPTKPWMGPARQLARWTLAVALAVAYIMLALGYGPRNYSWTFDLLCLAAWSFALVSEFSEAAAQRAPQA